jgi:hypothetical protein
VPPVIRTKPPPAPADRAPVSNLRIRNTASPLIAFPQKEKDCSDIAVTTRQDKADYTLTLNHIEHGFVRDNQIRLANTDGDVLLTKEGGSIAKNVKTACGLILDDWKKKSAKTQ